jgi:hypothetical protein
MDSRPENELKEKTHRLEMDYHQVPLSLLAVKKKISIIYKIIKKKTLIMKHVIIDWTGTTVGWWTK